jgi:hypothetical protein
MGHRAGGLLNHIVYEPLSAISVEPRPAAKRVACQKRKRDAANQ